MNKAFASLIPLIAFLTLLPSLPALTYSDSATLWAEYAASPETHPNIPNNSFAGYHRGEKPVPDVPVVANLLDYGGVGDGIYDNTEAFRQAIDAAYRAGGGAVLIPAGDYFVDDMIQMHRSGVVLRGEGQSSTSLVFGKPLLDVLGNPDPISTSRWNWMGGLIWMSPLTSFRRENTVHDFRPVYPEDFTTGTLTQEHWHQGPELASVIAEAPMGSRTIELDDASHLYEGQMVLMSWDNLDTFDLLYEVGGHPLMETADWGKWLTSQTYLPRWQWPVEILYIDGNTVTLAQPIRFATTAKYNCRIWDIGDSVSEAGVENLTIVLDAMNVLFHNQGLGWNAIFINQAYDCWVRNVDIVNAENGVHITSAKGISILNTQILGDRPCHHPYTSRLNSHDCLWDGFTIDYTGDGYCQHGINTEFLCSGHVWTRGDMEFGTMDSHRAASFDLLRTEITMRNEKQSWTGGSTDAGPYQGRRAVHWNLDIHDSNRIPGTEGLYVYHEQGHSMGVLAGIRGAAPYTVANWAMPFGDKGNIIADDGLVPTPANLYDAQLDLRRDTQPWIHLSEPNTGFSTPGLTTLTATANPGVGRSVALVAYYIDGVLLDSSTSGPDYAVSWDAAFSEYWIDVYMQDDLGNEYWSVPQFHTIGNRIYFQEDNPNVVFGGTGWETWTSPLYSGNAMETTTSSNASFQLTFRGNRFKLITGQRSQDAQIWDIYLDDLLTPWIAGWTSPGPTNYGYEILDSGFIGDDVHTIKVVNRAGRFSMDAIEVWMTTANTTITPPVSVLSATPLNGMPPLAVSYNGASSYDSDGFVVSYAFDFGDGSPVVSSSIPSANHTYTTEGEYTAVLTVTDNDGATHQATVDIFVGNKPPIAVAAADILEGNPPLTVNFNGSGSSDPDGSIALYEWDFDNNGTWDATGSPIPYIFNAAGLYWVNLRVTDNNGATATDFVEIQVNGLFAPVILSQPQDATVYDGYDALFAFEMGGNPLPDVTWYQNDVAIPDSNSPTLVLQTVELSDDGNTYYAILTNTEGSVQTATVTLTVEVPPPGYSVRIVDWGGEYVSGSNPSMRLNLTSDRGVAAEFGDDGLNDDYFNGVLFSEAAPMSPAIGATYDGQSATFYGGLERWRIDNTESILIRDQRIEDRVGGDVIYSRLSNGLVYDFRVFMWKKEDFLNLATTDIAFNSSSRMEVLVSATGGWFPHLRFLVKNGGAYYLSEAFVQADSSVNKGPLSFSLSGDALRDVKWAIYDPTAGMQPVPGMVGVQSKTLTYAFATSSFMDIQAVGVFAERTQNQGSGNVLIEIKDFEVTAASAAGGGFNQPPTVTISSPDPAGAYTEPASITLTADASDADGSIASVEFFLNGESVGLLNAAPFSIDLILDAGDKSFTAVATDDLGSQTVSAPVQITIGAPSLAMQAASWIGGSSDDRITGSRILSDGTLVLAAEIGDVQPGGLTPILLNGATATSRGAIIRLAPDGRSVLSVTRVADKITDLATDDSNNLYVAAPNDGLLKLNSTATTVTAKQLTGEFVYRVDASGDGYYAGLVMSSISDPDTTSGAGTASIFQPLGILQVSVSGVSQNTLDLCVDSASETLVLIGWRQTSASAADNPNVLPVQIAALRGYSFAGATKWTNYNWEAGPYDPENPNHLNVITNNMADSRGLRCSIGDDGMLYAAFEVAGGNHIFRYEPNDLSQPADIVGGDMWHEFYNTNSEHKTFFARYEVATGKYLLGQQFCTRFWDGSSDKGNAARVTGGDIHADTLGRVYLVGASASGLPMEPVHGFSADTDEIAFNPFDNPVYTGGAFLLAMSQDFSTRRLLTRLSGGTARSIDARSVSGSADTRIVFGAESGSINVNWNGIDTNVGGQLPSDPRYLAYLHHPLQALHGGGNDGFFAALRTADLAAPTIITQPVDVTVPEGTIVSFEVKSEGTPPESFVWKRDDVSIPFANASVYSLVATEADNGAAFSCTVANASGSVNSIGAILTIGTPGTLPFADWIGLYYPGSSDPAEILPGSDGDFDGLNNLLEYLLGLNPSQPDRGGAISVINDGANVVLVFTVSKTATGITWTVEHSTDLSSWFDDSVVTIQQVDDLGDAWLYEADAPVNPIRFLRLSVTQP